MFGPRIMRNLPHMISPVDTSAPWWFVLEYESGGVLILAFEVITITHSALLCRIFGCWTMLINIGSSLELEREDGIYGQNSFFTLTISVAARLAVKDRGEAVTLPN